VCWPLRRKPVYLSYAFDAQWHESCFIAVFNSSMQDAALYKRVWIDKDEGVAGSPHCAVDRYDAMTAAQVMEGV
jgi:hypothetical protein